MDYRNHTPIVSYASTYYNSRVVLAQGYLIEMKPMNMYPVHLNSLSVELSEYAEILNRKISAD